MKKKQMCRMNTLKISALAVAVFAVYPTAYTANLTLTDGGTHFHANESYDFVEVRYGTPRTALTTLHASNLTINDARGGNNMGAVFAKGATINISDSTIKTTITKSGLQAYSARGPEAPTTITGNRLEINTEGDSAHGAFLYFERNREDRSNTDLIINSSTIHTTGTGSNGLLVGGTGDPAFQGHGVLTVSNSSIHTKGNASTGVKAQFNGNAVLNESHITTTGASAHGANATTGGTVLLNQGSVSTRNATGLYAEGGGSEITTGGTTVSTTEGAYGAHAKGGGHITLKGGSVNNGATRAGAMGIFAQGSGSRIDATDVAITASGEFINSGEPSNVVSASNGAAITLAGGSVKSLSTQFARGILASGNASVEARDVAISTQGIRSHAVQAWSASKTGTDGIIDKPAITISGGAIDTIGSDSYGLMAQNNGSIVNVTGSNVTTQGTNAYGAVAYNGSVITLKDVAVKTSGTGAHGISMGATSPIETPAREPVSNIASSVSMTGGSIRATGENASAVHLQDGGSVVLNDVHIEAAGASITSQLEQAGQTQNITVGSGSSLTVNDGTLLQVNRSTQGMDGTVNLTLKAGSVATGRVIDLDGLIKGGPGTRPEGGKTNFSLETGAQWAGIIWGINDANIGDGGNFVDDGGKPIAGNVISGSNSTITFNNGASITGGVQTDTGSTATFHGPTTIGQSVTGTGSSYVFLGPTVIGQNVAGANTSFSFSQSAPTAINGSVMLTVGSTLTGGAPDTPITIQGDASVNSGSTLGGNLDVKGALSGDGGTLSPGNSIGTHVYTTSAEFTGAYKAEVNAAGQSDLITIRNGPMDLSGIDLIVAQENGNGGYMLGHDYTIVQTINGTIENTFASQRLDTSFADTLVRLNPAKYGAQDVKVSLAVDADKVTAKRSGLSTNQNATLDGVISVAGVNTAADAALQSADTKDVLNQLSGELHGSTQSALLNSSNIVMRTLSNRMRGNVGTGLRAGAPTAQAAGSTYGAMPTSNAYPLWVEVVGNWNSLSSNDSAARVRTSQAGLFIGTDALVGKGWRIGGALGFMDGNIKVNDRSSKSDVRSYTAALYGGNSWAVNEGQLNLLAGAAYTRHDVDSRRHVSIGGNQTLKADYKANGTQLFTELGYAFPVGQSSNVEPYLGVAWLNQRARSFHESGGSAALRGDSHSDSITTMTLGLRGNTTIDTGSSQATFTGGLGWRHAAGDVDPSREMAFIQGNGTAFKVAGAPIAKNAAVVDLGAEMAVGKSTALGLNYSGQFGNGNTDNTGSLYLKMRF